MSITKRILGFLFVALLTNNQLSQAQTTIINPLAEGGFELGTTFAANGWTLVNYTPGTGNNWRLTTSTLNYGPYSFAPTGSRAAFISQHTSGTTWTYNINEYSTTHFYRDVTFPAGEELIQLDFRWNAQGEGTMSAAYDVLYVFICPPTLTPVTHSPYGTSSSPSAWTGTGTATLIGSFHTNPNVSGKTESITLPASYAGTNQRIVFTWKNGNTLGVQPPAAVDSISLKSDCHRPVLTLNNASIPCSGSVVLNTSVHFGSMAGTYAWYVNDVLQTGMTGTSFTSTSVSSGDEVKCIYYFHNACSYSDTASIVLDFGVSAYVTDSVVLCSNELPYTWQGYTLPSGIASGTYANYRQKVFTKSDGCDSILQLHLTVRNTPAPVTETISTCRGMMTGLTWRGISIDPSAQSHSKYDSVTVYNPYGCDSVFYLNLQVMDSSTSVRESYVGCGSVTFRGQRYYADATVVDTFRNMSGCDSLYIFNDIVVDDFEISIASDDTPFIENTMMQLYLVADEHDYNVLSWSPAALFPLQNNHVQDIYTPLAEDITVIAQNANGCLDTATYTIRSIKYENDVLLPNAFSPNGDGLNDVFKPIFAMEQHIHRTEMIIYNRWGNSVFHHFAGGNTHLGWDGTVNGEPVTAGVYYYVITIYFMDNTQKEFKGDVTLIR